MKKFHYLKASKQNGIATLLILILVGVSISVAVFGSLRYIQGSQNQTTALHAQTQAQITAWSGVEVIYQYLKNISSGDMAALITAAESATATAPVEVGFDGMSALSAGFYKDGGDLYALIRGTTEAGTRAQSTSTVEVIYHAIAPNPNDPKGGDCAPFCSDAPPSVITFNRDLRVSGGIVLSSSSEEDYQINVKGVMSTSGSLVGVDIINATDSVFLGGANTVLKKIHSNGDVRIDNSVTVTERIEARGSICLTNGGAVSQKLARANGFAYAGNSAKFSAIQSKGESLYIGENEECLAYLRKGEKGEKIGVWLDGNSSADGFVQSSASVIHDSGTIDKLKAEGDLYITADDSTVSGEISGDMKEGCRVERLRVANCSGKASVDVDDNEDINVSLKDVPPVEMKTAVFNAYDYEKDANYAFKNVNGKIEVTVRDVEGIEEGVYYIKEYKPQYNNYKDYLCKVENGSDCKEIGKTICKTSTSTISGHPPGAYENWNACFSYSNGKWTVGGGGSQISIAQGVVWFKGDVDLKGDEYYNTFIATGHIVTSGSHNNVAPNFAGPKGGPYKRQSDGISVNTAFKGICSEASSSYKPFFPYYPKSLCEALSIESPLPIANYAYMAGSIADDGEYVGGNITIASGTGVYGSVLAGNEFIGKGGPTIFGYITALAAGKSRGDNANAIEEGVRIVADGYTDYFSPTGVIDLELGSGQADSPGDGTYICNSPVCLAGDAYIATKFSARYR